MFGVDAPVLAFPEWLFAATTRLTIRFCIIVRDAEKPAKMRHCLTSRKPLKCGNDVWSPGLYQSYAAHRNSAVDSASLQICALNIYADNNRIDPGSEVA